MNYTADSVGKIKNHEDLISESGLPTVPQARELASTVLSLSVELAEAWQNTGFMIIGALWTLIEQTIGSHHDVCADWCSVPTLGLDHSPVRLPHLRERFRGISYEQS